MKQNNFTRRLTGTLAAALLMGGGGGLAYAAGTASGITISNSASLDFQVGGVGQDTVNSNNHQFVVDNKVNLTVATTDGAAVVVNPNATLRVLTFTVTNNGNTAQDFALSATAVATSGATKFDGASDAFDASVVNVYVESGATGGYQAGEDIATHIDALAADGAKTVYIVSTIPGSATNGQYASYHLLAEARTNDGAGTLGGALTQTAGADTAGSVDIVFADGQGSDTASDASRDAKHSSQSDYKVAAAVLSIVKSSTVISDPFNNTTNPKRIPGAVVEYVVTVSNGAGASTATSITITDNLNTEIATNGTLAFNAQYNATAGKGIVVAHPDHSGGAETEYTNADDGAEFGGVSAKWDAGANTVTVSGISLDASESATVKFRVTVQ